MGYEEEEYVVSEFASCFPSSGGNGSSAERDDKISALEQELQQLKESQIELKKEATAAAAAMPSFSYRPGNGMMIEAADKSWSFRHSFEAHMRYNFTQGRDQVGRSHGRVGRAALPAGVLSVRQ